MEKTSNYFPKTIAALSELKETAAQLENSAANVQNTNQKLQEKTTALRKQIATKAAKIEEIIKNLDGALK